jgi:hypothetical protein
VTTEWRAAIFYTGLQDPWKVYKNDIQSRIEDTAVGGYETAEKYVMRSLMILLFDRYQ